MSDFNIALPSKPKLISEEDFKNSQKIEIFEAVHEVIERMMNTSKVTLENLK